MMWCSLVPPLPAPLVSYFFDRDGHDFAGLSTVPWSSWAAVLYLGLVASLLAYALWGSLLQRHSASALAPFALLSPCVGTLLSAVVFGERFSGTRYAGMALIFAGLVINVVPRTRRLRIGQST
jgi:O-acetylserine/cysteine efflux transporter